MKYYLIAGEASGDLHASHLMRELKARDSRAEFRFLGGDLMEAEGGTLVHHYKEVAYMGFIPVLLHLNVILRRMEECKRDILDWQPDVVILVDYAGFNLRIARFAEVTTDKRSEERAYVDTHIEYGIGRVKSPVTRLVQLSDERRYCRLEESVS